MSQAVEDLVRLGFDRFNEGQEGHFFGCVSRPVESWATFAG